MITALVQFQHRIVSGDSPYDRWLLGEAELSTEQLMGLEFLSQCGSAAANVTVDFL